VLPISIQSILSFPYGHPVAAYVFFLVFPSILSVLQQRVLFKAVPTHLTKPVSLLSFLPFIVCRTFLLLDS